MGFIYIGAVFSIKKNKFGAGKMAPWLRALVTLAKDPGSVSRTHKAVHNQLWLQFQGICCLLLALTGTACIWYAGKTLIHIKQNLYFQENQRKQIIILNSISLTQKDKYHVFLICGIFIYLQTYSVCVFKKMKTSRMEGLNRIVGGEYQQSVWCAYPKIS